MSESVPDPAEWTELKAAFTEIVDLPPAARSARLDQIGIERPELATRLRILLQADAIADERLVAWEHPATEDVSPPDTLDPLGLIGSTVGHFRVGEILGRGGMGIAYRALDTRLDRPVALKFLLPGTGLDAHARIRLLNEARAASALDHVNVCTIFEVGETENGLFFAMPAYTGETLRDRLAREGALPATMAIDLMRQLLRGLAAAHAAGITHRDLKPGNLILTANGTLKILDFGLATVRDIEDTSPSATPGTMAYMSPEQLGGGDADHRTDLWSAGVVLHEMLTGHPPFGGSGSLATPYSILHDDPPPAGAGPELDTFTAKLLARRPEDRFETADAALAALEASAANQGGEPALRSRRRFMAGAVLAVIVLAGGWFLSRDSVSSGIEAIDPSVAVLPFIAASSDSAQQYLGEGVAEEILRSLTLVPGLRVPGRRSSFAFTDSAAPFAEVARRLGVSALLLGSIDRSGDRVTVDARLVDGRTNLPLWSDSWDRPIGEIGTIESEIVTATAEAFNLSPARSRSTPRDFQAYELYLRGLFHWNRRTPRDLALAVDFFQQATDRDSTYAPAWAGLALAWSVLPALDGSSIELLDRAQLAAARALALDSTLSDAWAARAYALHWQWRWAEAEAAFRRAVALESASSTAYEWYGEFLAKMGRTDEGERMVRHAIDLDPLALVARNDLGIVLMLGRRLDEAIAQFREVNQADPAFALPLLLEHRTYLVMGNADAAAESGRRAAELMRMSEPDELVLLARATGDTTLHPQAMAVLERWERRPAPSWPEIAMYATLLGDTARAINALEAAMFVRSPQLASLRMVPWADPLRSNARFQEILRQLAFP